MILIWFPTPPNKAMSICIHRNLCAIPRIDAWFLVILSPTSCQFELLCRCFLSFALRFVSSGLRRFAHVLRWLLHFFQVQPQVKTPSLVHQTKQMEKKRNTAWIKNHDGSIIVGNASFCVHVEADDNTFWFQ